MLARAVPLVLALVGCAPDPVKFAAREAELAQAEASRQARRAEIARQQEPPRTAEEAEQREKNRIAVAGCQARAQMAQAMHWDRSLLGLYGQAAAGTVLQACIDHYKATGIVPGV
jgi:hypothetical protein